MKESIFHSRRKNGGFSIVETVVSIGIFVILSLAVYQATLILFKGTQLDREGANVSALADQYMEIARNLPYSQVGTISGNPSGSLADNSIVAGSPGDPGPIVTTYNGSSYKIYYEVTYIDDPADGTCSVTPVTDSDCADYKQVKLSITNTTTSKTYYFVTTIVPQGLEGLAAGGALSITVGDSNGNPVPYANIAITSVGLATPISLSRTADSTGHWIEVGLPDGSDAYHIVVTGPTGGGSYSTAQTYPVTVGNPNPSPPDATIANGQVTAESFYIDKTSTLSFHTEDTSCNPLPILLSNGDNLEVRGSKLIGGVGTSSPIYKYDNAAIYTDGSGNTTLSNMEYDTYTPAIGGGHYMVFGSSPAQPISLGANTTQLFNLILGAWTSNSFLVTVKDASTNNPIEDASVLLSSSSSPTYSATKYTGGSIWSQSSWAGGSGQATWSTATNTKYFSDDGGIDNSGVRLLNNGVSPYTATIGSGSLISSTFDTGASTTAYTTLTWLPISETCGTSCAKFQIATNNDNATWTFTGPDGTSGTYYNVSGTTINPANNGHEYIRYKMFLNDGSPAVPSHNPVITNVTVNYVSSAGCFTPGQVIFPGLSTGSNYTLTVSATGYTTKTITPLTVNGGYNATSVSLSS